MLAEIEAQAKMMQAENSSDRSMANSLRQEALQILAQAVDITNAGRLPNGAANPLKPAHELYGEMLVGAGRHEEAAAVFEESLLRTPNRPWSLLGAARAYVGNGDMEKAAEKYTALLAVWTHANNPALSEARAFVANH